MTIIRPNSISGVTSITAQGGDINVYRADGTKSDIFINNITGVAATFTGNLNVGGVLTYEDVANIDSVGIITARSGIRIGATGANTLITGNGTGIGIGITTPQEELHIRAATPVIRLEDGDNARQSQIVGSDGNLRLDADNGNAIADTNIAFRTDGGERLRIGPVGQIGIGGANYGTSGQVLTSAGSGSAVQWATPAGGKVLQAVTASSTSATFASNTTFVDSGLSASITPSATSSKVLVFVTQHYISRRSSASMGGSVTLYRGSTKLTNDINGSDPYKIHLNITGATYVEQQGEFNTTYLDSPNTTSATTYKTMRGAAYGNNSALMGVSNDGTASYITLLEIGA